MVVPVDPFEGGELDRFEALPRRGGDSASPRRAATPSALAVGNDWRREYYGARLEGVAADFPAVADVIGRLPESGAPPHRVVE